MKIDSRYSKSNGQKKFRVQSSEFRVQSSEFGVQSSAFRVQSSEQPAARLNDIVGQTGSYNKEYSTVQHSKQLVLKKASRNVANVQHGKAFGFNHSSSRFSERLRDDELTIRAC